MGAPVGAAGVGALEGALDGGFAAAAGLVFAAVDPQVFAGVGAVGGPAILAAVSNDPVARVFEDVCGEKLLRRRDYHFRL